MDASKTSSMMFEHLENYVLECVAHHTLGSISAEDNRPATFFDEHDRVRNEDTTINPGIDYYTIASIEQGSSKSDRIYACVGRMFIFFIHAKSLKTFISNGKLEYENGTLTPEYVAYRDIKRILYHPTDLVVCKLEVAKSFPYTIRTDDREKLLQELVVHVRTDHVFRTWSPATQLATPMKVSGKAASSGVIDLAVPPAGQQKFLFNGYFFFLPESFEKGGVGVFQGADKELIVDIMDPQEVSTLNSQETRLLKQETEAKARELVGHGSSLNFLTMVSGPYTKRMNLRGDLSSWGCYQVWNKVGRGAANSAVIGLRRKFIPSNGNTYQNIFLTLKSREAAAEDDPGAADAAFIELLRSCADSLSPEAVPGVYDEIVVSQTAKALVLDNGSLDWFLQRLSLLPELGWGWEGAQVQFVRYVVSLLEETKYPEVTDEEFTELCRDEYGDHLPGLNTDAFEDPFKEFITVLPPLGGLPVPQWEARVAGYLGYCLDGGILPDYITMEGLLMVTAYKSHPEFWRHISHDPKAMAKLKDTSEKIQILVKYFLHVRLLEESDKEAYNWAQPWLPELSEEAKLAGVKKGIKPDEDMPAQLKPQLFRLNKQHEMLEITYNTQLMTRLIQSGYLRWDFFPKIEPDRQIDEEASAKLLRKFVKVPKAAKQPAVVPAGSPGEDSDDLHDTQLALPRKAVAIDQWIATKESAVKAVFMAKEERIAAGQMHIDKDDREITEPALLEILKEHESYEAKEKLAAKDRQKFNTFTEGLLMTIRYLRLVHAKCNSIRDYFQLLVYLMEDSEDADLLCAISQEVASLAELVYQQRRAASINVRSVTVPFNPCLMLPFSQPVGGDDGRNLTIVTAIVQNYVLKHGDEYLTLCGLRCLINMAGLSDECKGQIMGDNGRQLLSFVTHKIRDYYNNESILAAFCILIRNLASSPFGRQICSCNLELRGRLLRHCHYMLQQDAIVLGTGSPTRNMMTAEACACLWKLVQPYEQDAFRKEREETVAQMKRSKSKAKPPEPRLESPLLEDLVQGKYQIVEQLYVLVKAHVEAEMTDSSNQVLEKACGLAMAIAAADNTIKGMDDQVRELERRGEYKVVERLKMIRIKANKGKQDKDVPVCVQMGPRFVELLCKALICKQRSRAVVEKAAGALCVLLYDAENLKKFKENLDDLQSFLGMTVTKQEHQLNSLMMKLQIFAAG